MKARYVLLGLLIGVTVWAQPVQRRPTTETTDVDRILPQLQFDNKSVDDVVNYLSDVSGANIVIVRERGVPNDYPTISAIRMKNVTVSQFMAFLQQAYPGVDVRKTEGPASSIYLIRISAASRGDGRLFGSNQAQTPIVRIYNLSDAIGTLTSHKPNLTAEQKTEAVNQLLSLIQAALDQQGEKEKPVLSVHQPTQTLIFKGNANQLGIVDQTLSALRSSNALTSTNTTYDKILQDTQYLRSVGKYDESRNQQLEQDLKALQSDDAAKAADQKAQR